MENRRTRRQFLVYLPSSQRSICSIILSWTRWHYGVFLGGLASCPLFGAANESHTDSVEGIKDFPGDVEESIDNLIGDSLPIGHKVSWVDRYK